jgi:hypothetical protein
LKVFQLHGVSNANMTFLLKDEGDLYRGDYGSSKDVTRLLWEHPPELILRSAKQNQRKHKGRKLKLPDIGHFTPGALIFSEKARDCLGEYFLRFGKFTSIQVEGEMWFNYDVTNIIGGVVDVQGSTYSKKGKMITKPAFIAEKLPQEPQIFKIPEMHLVDIYFNDNGSDTVRSMINKFRLEAGDMPLVWDA